MQRLDSHIITFQLIQNTFNLNHSLTLLLRLSNTVRRLNNLYKYRVKRMQAPYCIVFCSSL